MHGTEVIPDEAVEAAAEGIYKVAAAFAYEPDTWEDLDDDQRNTWIDDALRILDAAAPRIRAQALEDAAGVLSIVGRDIDPWGKPTRENYADWLRNRAASERTTP